MRTLKMLNDDDLVPSNFEDLNFEEIVDLIRKSDSSLFGIVRNYAKDDFTKISYIMSILVNSGAVIKEGNKWKLCDEEKWRQFDFISK